MKAADVLDMSLADVADAIRQRVVSSEEVTRACIERAEATHPSVNAFISLEAEEALSADRSTSLSGFLKPTIGAIRWRFLPTQRA